MLKQTKWPAATTKTRFRSCIMRVLHAYLQTHYNSINVSFTLCLCRLKRLSKPPLHFSVNKLLKPFFSINVHALSGIVLILPLSFTNQCSVTVMQHSVGEDATSSPRVRRRVVLIVQVRLVQITKRLKLQLGILEEVELNQQCQTHKP